MHSPLGNTKVGRKTKQLLMTHKKNKTLMCAFQKVKPESKGGAESWI